MTKKRLVLAIRSLDVGGAERQFIELVKGIDKTRFDVTVCTMYGGEREDEVRRLEGIRYVHLRKKGRYDLWRFGRRYRALLHEIRPDVIYAFLGEMNLFSLWCKPKESRLIWGLRASDMDLRRYGRVPQVLFALQKHLSRRVDRIIANSYASVRFHANEGFDMSRTVVIPNGIDTTRFRPDVRVRRSFRAEYGLAEESVAVGIVARLDPMKGYEVLAEAMLRVMRADSRVHFFAAGSGDHTIRERCETILGAVAERVHWLGMREDVEAVYNGVDLLVSSSLFGEGFSNSVAEAMACATPCIVTDVGDSARIVGYWGKVVRPDHVGELAEAVSACIQEASDIRGPLCRRRIVGRFSLERMVSRTQEVVWKEAMK